MTNREFSRRDFLRGVAGVAGTAAAPFALNLAALGSAAAAGASDYKALVCLYMIGGNDHYNTLLATDPESWSEYQRLRNTQTNASIALRGPALSTGVIPIAPLTAHPGRSFGLHPQLGALKALFDGGRVAAVANVGTLLHPTTKAQYLNGSAALPPKLFSHNDQQAVWLSSQAEGAQVGWGGRMGDMLASANSSSSFACVSAAGNSVFLSGRTVQQYQLDAAGAVPISGIGGRVLAATVPLPSIIAGPQTNKLRSAYTSVTQRAINLQSTLEGALAPAGGAGIANPGMYVNPVTGVAAVNPVAVQLQTVARLIAGRGSLGMKRQVFFVSMGSFDTHDNQTARHADLMARLAHAIRYFDTTMANVMGANLQQNVTLFTASDFGRTLVSNGDGTDHGWGSHHFVVGGAVKGRNIYGAFPTIGLGHENDVSQGVLLPSISVDQYGATLARWFGLSDSQLNDVFPNLRNFSARNLGFMT